MHAAPRHGTPSLTSRPKDGRVSCFGRSSGRSPMQFFDRTQPCLTSVKLMELAGPLGHSPRGICHTMPPHGYGSGIVLLNHYFSFLQIAAT